MAAPKNLSSFTCELTILQAKNIQKPPPKSDLFVRFYLSLSKNSRCTLNTKEIKSSSPTCSWNETFSLQCNGGADSIAAVMEEASVVFELRQRSRRLLSKKSKVVGRAEVPWRRVIEAPGMELEAWVDCGGDEGGNRLPASICVGVKVSENSRVSRGKMDTGRRRRRNGRKAGECRCKDCQDLYVHSCEDYYDAFAVAALF